jgi:peptidoglycan/LPS O-acetylase OafA/YrhL
MTNTIHMPQTERRFPELDALRGLAAAIVVFSHFFQLVLPLGRHTISNFVLHWSPLRIFFAGHEAVILFFLLSGFVLTLGFMNQQQPYASFITKRVFRIYAPYVCSLAFAVVGAYFLYGATPISSPWFAITWSQPVSWLLVLQHCFFIGKYDVAQFNTAFWSLVYEMRISLIFPALYIVAKRVPLNALLLSALAASWLAWWRHSVPYSAEWVITLHYAGIFVCGSLLAQNVNALRNRIASTGSSLRVALTALAFLLIAYGQGTPTLMSRFSPLTDWPVILGCSWLMIFAISSDSLGAWLRSTVPQFLGKISYSLYLIHGTILFAAVHLMYPNFSLAYIFPSALIAIVVASYWFHLWIERPCIATGKRVASALAAKQFADSAVCAGLVCGRISSGNKAH